MQWVDQETYVGPCRRIAQRPHLHHRRRENLAQSSPPDLRSLLAYVTLAFRMGDDVANRPRTRMRIVAGFDLAMRLGDNEMIATFGSMRNFAASLWDAQIVR